MARSIIAIPAIVSASADEAWWREFIASGATPPEPKLEPQASEFLTIANRFLTWLVMGEGVERGDHLQTRKDLWRVMFRQFAREYLAGQLMDARQVAPSLALGRSLKNYCARLEVLRFRCDWIRRWQDLFPWYESNRPLSGWLWKKTLEWMWCVTGEPSVPIQVMA